MSSEKLALVGCGRVSKRHIEVIQATVGIDIAAVCDIDENKVKKLSEQLSTYDELNIVSVGVGWVNECHLSIKSFEWK